MLVHDTNQGVSSRELLVRSYLRAEPSLRGKDDDEVDEAVVTALWGHSQLPDGDPIRTAVERSRRAAVPARVGRAPIGTGFSELRKAMGVLFGVTYMPAVLTFAAWTGTTVSFPVTTLLPTRGFYETPADRSKGMPFVLSDKTLRDIVNLPAQASAAKSALEVRRAPMRSVKSEIVEASAFTEQATPEGHPAVLIPSRTWVGMYRDSMPEVSGNSLEVVVATPSTGIPSAPTNLRLITPQQ